MLLKESFRCKLVLDNKTLKLVRTFEYIECQISKDPNLYNEVKEQKTSKVISGCLDDITWRNKIMSTEAEVK